MSPGQGAVEVGVLLGTTPSFVIGHIADRQAVRIRHLESDWWIEVGELAFTGAAYQLGVLGNPCDLALFRPEYSAERLRVGEALFKKLVAQTAIAGTPPRGVEVGRG